MLNRALTNTHNNNAQQRFSQCIIHYHRYNKISYKMNSKETQGNLIGNTIDEDR